MYICTSDCRYRPKASVVLVSKQKFTESQQAHLTLTQAIRSIDGEFYNSNKCKTAIKKNKILSCNEKKFKFLIDNLPQNFLTPQYTLSKLKHIC